MEQQLITVTTFCPINVLGVQDVTQVLVAASPTPGVDVTEFYGESINAIISSPLIYIGVYNLFEMI